MPTRSLLPALEARLSSTAKDASQQLVRLAEGRSEALYLVGGSVRDLLLERPEVDLDIAVEGDAVALAQELAAATGGQIVVHPSFGTASVTGRSFRLDLAQTRAESYLHPGSLPVVRPASLEEDLARRDFTVNAMALKLTRRGAGRLVDPFSGRRDIEQATIRVLHEASFRDDATRMLRAVRYESRLSFQIDETTRQLIERDLTYLDTISGARVSRELIMMFYEPRPQTLLARCEELGLLAAIAPALHLDPEGARALLRAEEERAAPWDEVCLCLIAWGSDEPGVSSLVKRLSLARRHQLALCDTVKLRALLPVLQDPSQPPSSIVETLEPLAIAAVWALRLMIPGGLVGERTGRFLKEWRHLRPFLNGRALKRMGVPEGPRLGALLRMLRKARLDGLTSSREDEVAFVERLRSRTGLAGR
jgi:tRNA nucleotidyltransferase (CCA-adding enzyme)